MCAYMSECHMCVGSCGGQKRGWDPLELVFQSVGGAWHGCWELNLSPPEEQQALLTMDPSIKPLTFTNANLYILLIAFILLGWFGF